MHMVRRILPLLLICLLLTAASAETGVPYTYEVTGKGTVYESDSLVYSIEIGKIDATKVYVTRVWMAEPGKQIRKVTSPWHQRLAKAEDLAAKVPKAALAINGSGYVSKAYPWIPEEYPGESEDYYCTPLGSLTVTDGKVLRNLEGIPYYGLTLEADGLHMYVGADNAEVLAAEPAQTWSFYVECPLIRDGESILDRSWPFANRMAVRTVIAKVDDHNYVILTATSQHGLTLLTCTDFLLNEFHPEWAYNLDGGPSSALIRRKHGSRTQKLVYGSKQSVVDVMVFQELPKN
jgi:exopolysaccharide biosynthesis protein